MAKAEKILELGRTAEPVSSSVCVGWVVEWSCEGGPVVDFAGNVRGPLPARSTVVVEATAAIRAVETRQGVVLTFERDREDLPIILGLVQPGPAVVADLEGGPATAEVDGRRDRQGLQLPVLGVHERHIEEGPPVDRQLRVDPGLHPHQAVALRA